MQFKLIRLEKGKWEKAFNRYFLKEPGQWPTNISNKIQGWYNFKKSEYNKCCELYHAEQQNPPSWLKRVKIGTVTLENSIADLTSQYYTMHQYQFKIGTLNKL